MSFCVSHDESTGKMETIGKTFQGTEITFLGLCTGRGKVQSWKKFECHLIIKYFQMDRSVSYSLL